MYSPSSKFPVYCQKCWWGDSWDGTDYGTEYDFNKPFFTQLHELQWKIPRLALQNKNPVNSEYCNYATNNKNCYLCFSIGGSEETYYSGPQIVGNKNCFDCSMSVKNENCYHVIDCAESYNLLFSHNCIACRDSAFLWNCRNCSNCLGCVNLRNKEYCIFNRQYSKGEYGEKLRAYGLNTYSGLKEFEGIFKGFKAKQIHRFAVIDRSSDCTGDSILNSKACHSCFAVVGSENCKYSFILNNAKDSFDCNNFYPSGEESYEVISLIESTKTLFGVAAISNSSFSEYVDTCAGAQNCFGCIGIKNKQYCILNKQYSKKSYSEILPRIKEHMQQMPYLDSHNRRYGYGEFFPMDISPYSYNESLAQEYFPLTPEEIKQHGYGYRDLQPVIYKTTIESSDIPDDIETISPNILDETLECAHKNTCGEPCSAAFKILPQELQFHKVNHIPLPRLCVKCRAFSRIRERNPLKLWKRLCGCKGEKSQGGIYSNTAKHSHGDASCPNEFETTYSPDRPEIVYCENCYNAEVV